MSPEAKALQSNTAKELISNYINDLSEDDGFTVLHALMRKFDWAGTVMCRGDIESAILNYALDEDEPDPSPEEMKEFIDRIVGSWEWKHMDDTMAEAGWVFVNTAVSEVVRGEVYL